MSKKSIPACLPLARSALVLLSGGIPAPYPISAQAVQASGNTGASTPLSPHDFTGMPFTATGTGSFIMEASSSGTLNSRISSTSNIGDYRHSLDGKYMPLWTGMTGLNHQEPRL